MAYDILLLRGAPGVGKTSLCAALRRMRSVGAVIDVDDVWATLKDANFNTGAGYNLAVEQTMTVAHGLVRGGVRPIIVAAPFDALAYPAAQELASGGGAFRVGSIALFCDPTVLVARLEARPHGAYRDAEAALAVNDDMMRNTDAYDNTSAAPALSAEYVAHVCAFAREMEK